MTVTLKDLLAAKLAIYGKTLADIKYVLLQSHTYNHEWKWTNSNALFMDISSQINVNENVNATMIIVGDDWWVEFANKSPTSLWFRTFPHLQPAHGLPQPLTKADLLDGF